MPNLITMSEEYVDTFKNLLKVTKVYKKNEILFFSDVNGNPMISCMDSGILVHIKGTPSHASYPDVTEFGVTSGTEFLEYIKALNYPKSGEMCISSETSTKGKVFDCIVFSNDYVKYRMIVADPTKFDRDKDKKIPSSRDTDPMQLVATFILTTDDLKQLTNDIKLMKLQSDIGTFNMTVDDDISMIMRGIERQQVTRKIDPINSKIFDSNVLRSDSINKYRIFPSRIFSYLSEFKCDFEVEIRYLPTHDIVGFKAFGKIQNKDKDDIEVFIGSTESTSHTMINFDIIE